MNLDFITPNATTVEWIDTYMQFHDNVRIQSIAERVATRFYDPHQEGWDQQPEDNIRAAFNAFMTEKAAYGITDEEINNQ